MRVLRTILRIAAAATIATAPLIATAGLASAATTTSAAPQRHCVVALTPASSEPPVAHCFATFADAQEAANVGPLTSVTIGIDYTGTGFTGSSLTWTESAGCGSYTASSMPTGWNDVIKSAKTSSGCGSTLYQNINFGGTSASVGVNSSASTFSTFNSQASSQKWCTSASC